MCATGSPSRRRGWKNVKVYRLPFWADVVGLLDLLRRLGIRHKERIETQARVHVIRVKKKNRVYEYGDVHVIVPREWAGRRVRVVVEVIQ